MYLLIKIYYNALINYILAYYLCLCDKLIEAVTKNHIPFPTCFYIPLYNIFSYTKTHCANYKVLTRGLNIEGAGHSSKNNNSRCLLLPLRNIEKRNYKLKRMKKKKTNHKTKKFLTLCNT